MQTSFLCAKCSLDLHLPVVLRQITVFHLFLSRTILIETVTSLQVTVIEFRCPEVSLQVYIDAFDWVGLLDLPVSVFLRVSNKYGTLY